MRRIDLFDIGLGDDTGDNRDILQQFRGACGRHHHLIHHRGALRKPEIHGPGLAGSDLFADRFVPDKRGAKRIRLFAWKRNFIVSLRVGHGTERRLLLHGNDGPGERLPRNIRNRAGYFVLGLRLQRKQQSEKR